MPSITVKNIPDELYAYLKQAAAMHRRSLNSEIIVCIEHALNCRAVVVGDVVAKAKLLRTKTRGFRVDDKQIEGAITTGRP